MNFFGKPAEGAAAQPAAGTAFGAIGGASKTSGFSFGAGADATKPGSFSFGATSPTPATTASIFGSTLNSVPTFGGAQPTQPPLFGGTPSAVTSPAQPTTGFPFGQQGIGSGFSGFGSPGTQANTAAATQSTTSPFGAKTTTWPSFGTALPTATMNFGQAAASTTSAFAAPAPASGFPTAPATNLSATTSPAFSATTSAAFAAPATNAFAAAAPTSTAFAAPTSTAFAAPTSTAFAAPAATGLGAGFGFGGNTALQKPAVTTASTMASGFGFGATPGIGGLSTTASTFSGFNFSQNPATTASTISFGNAAAKPALSFGSTTITPVPSTASAGTTLPAAATAFPATFGSSPLGQTTTAQPAATLSTMWGGATTITAVATAAPTSTLTFGIPAGTTANTGFTKPPSTTPATTNSAFGIPNPQQAAPAPTGLSFPATFGATSAPSIASMSPSIVSALSAPTKPISTSFSVPEVKSTAPAFSLNTTSPAVTAASTQPAASAPPPTFSPLQAQLTSLPIATTLNDKVTTTSTGIALGSLTVPSATSSVLTAAATTAVSTIATQAAPFQLTIPLTTTAVTTAGAPPPTTATSLVPSQPVPATSMNFGQLEDAINKWSLELEEQEKVFINQATQVNAWDKVLIANGEKIVALNEALQTVRTEQQSLDHELDFVLGQQRELEELLVPLEKELGNVVISDPEREHTYRLADAIDTQLKQMSEDLKEIIEHLNESNRREDNNDPIVQIGRILNAHMSSLQWIDSSTAQISNKLDTLSNMHNTIKRRNRMSFNLTYK